MKRRAVAVVVVLLLAVCGLLGGALLAQEPELTPEQQKLLKEADTLYAEGARLYQQAKFPEATERARKMVELLEQVYPKEKYPNGHPDLTTSLINLAGLLQAQGEYGKAEPLYRRALEMTEALFPKENYPQGHPNLATSLNNLATLLHLQGEDGKAEPLFRRALDMTEALFPKEKYPKGHPELATSLNNLASLLKAQGEYGKAEPLFRRALEMDEARYPKEKYPSGHRNLATGLNNLALLLQAQGEYGKAEPLFRRALEMYRGQTDQTARSAPEAVALNHAAIFPLTRDALLSVTRHLPDAQERTYADVWHSRAAITRVYQRRHLSLIAAATDESVRKDWDNLQSLRRQREQLIMAPLASPSQQAVRKEKLEALGKEIDKAEGGLLSRLPVLKHYEDLNQLGPDALQKRLPADAVLVDLLRYTFFEQDPKTPGRRGEKRTARYLAFVLSGKDVKRVELGTAAEIDTAVKDWREAITLPVPAGNDAARRAHEAILAAQAEKLRTLLWEPIQKQLPAETRSVYLAPDGSLTQLPWAALPGSRKGRILLDDYALAIVPHGPFLLEQLTPPPARSEKRPSAPEGLLLVGGIKYDDEPKVNAVASRGESVVEQQVKWDFLKGTEAERQLIAKLQAKGGPKLSADLSGAEAGTERLRQELEKARFAHVATHGFFADPKFRSVLQLDPKLFERRMFRGGNIGHRGGEGARSPLVLSGLVCAGANREKTPERGILSGDAIAGLLLDDLHLAVLSACDTGLGDVAGGEGVYGLERAFHIAGAKNVIASLWKVDDAATAALMALFYRKLWEEKKPPIEALREAQLSIYRNPDLIPKWAQGERAPNVKGVRPPSGEVKPSTEPVTTEGTAPVKLWAAFTLSGLGR